MMRVILKKSVAALIFGLVLYGVPAFAATQNFNAYGAGTGLAYGAAKSLETTSLAFPGFTLRTTGSNLQLDAPGYFGAINYEILGILDMSVDFNAAQSAFSLDLRDFNGYGGPETITLFGSDDTTVLGTYGIALSSSIATFNYMGGSGLVGAVSLSNIGAEGWSGILQSVTYDNAASGVPEPATMLLLGLGLVGLAGARRKLKP